jgi:molecular chaperone DnaK
MIPLTVPPMESGRVCAIGIDLGTTNSAVTEIVWDPDSGFSSGVRAGQIVPPTLRTLEIDQPTREGVFTSPLVPSVVAILPDGRIWVGEGAKRLRASPTEYGLVFERNLFYDTKNEMGLRKTYYRAPEAFNHASKIAGKVLEFIADTLAKMGALGGENRMECNDGGGH